MKFIALTPGNLIQESLFCNKNPKSEGFKQKAAWFTERQKEGLQIIIAKDDAGKAVGFIEFVPGEYAWRPVKATGYMFINCIMVYPNKARNTGVASGLIDACRKEAEKQHLNGIAAFTSNGSWLADKRLFEKHGFRQIDKQGRFELLVLPFVDDIELPRFVNWETELQQYKGWHLLYADQCPWHEKAVEALQKTAKTNGISLHVKQLASAAEAQKAPSGFGVFALVKDGKLLEDHYISATRFKSILKKELD
jgi:L-amino acid N-acyltransferase YncA